MNVHYQGTWSKSNLHHRLGDYGGLGRVRDSLSVWVKLFFKVVLGLWVGGWVVLTYGVGCRGGGRLL